MKTRFAHIVLIGFAWLMSGCAQYLRQPLTMERARLGAETPQFKKFASLPQPKEKIVAAVYKFRDQTGQYKDSETGASWSTAVTQGATSILLRALEESGWFIPIEREGLSNLLNERKIIRSSIANYNEKENDQLLPPLVFAGILMEGGIVSFDSNIMTGGIGARYFGTGASGQYREDRVTIYLRAVSTSNGRILKTVYTSKTILSQQIDIGVFRFVSTRRLLEAETGFTYNEPGEMAVKEAIEKAVLSLVMEGINDKLWQSNGEEEATTLAVKQYMTEKEDNTQIDVFGNHLLNRRSLFGIGARGTGLVFEGDYEGRYLFPGGELQVEYRANKPLSLGLTLGVGQVGTGDEFKATIGYVDVGLKYKFLNRQQTTPFIRLGAGLGTDIKNNVNDNAFLFNYIYPKVSTEFGMEYMVTSRLGCSGSLSYHVFLNDRLDGMTQGKYDDSIWGANVGVTYYLSFKKK